MRISFVIPAYNEERLLPKCLDSVEQEMARNRGADIEVIVVNNASTDRTGEIARSYSWVRVVDEPQKGLVRARKAGFLAATGEIIANVDSDTMLPPGWLHTVISEFSTNDSLAALSGPYIYYDLSAFQRLWVRLFYSVGFAIYLISHYVLRGPGLLQGGNFVVRRSSLEQVGGFDTTIEFYGEDTDVARRISKAGEVRWTYKLPMYTSGRRLLHDGIVRGGLRYAGHHFHTLLRGKVLPAAYTDIRKDS